MKTTPAEFLNVDLDLKSAAALDALVTAWGSRVIPIHAARTRGRHWMRFMLAGQPKTPAQAILRFCRLVEDLPGPARAVWKNAASREFDIGIQAGIERRAAEWVLEPKVLAAVASVGGRIRLTIYSPLLLMGGKKRGRRGRAVRGRSGT